jgi:hypothetical protein
MEQVQIEQFALLFAGLTRAKGRYVSTTDPSQLVVGDKSKGRATTITEPVTLDDYRRHLSGELGLGIVPIRDDGTCVFGAIDIDQYAGLDHQALVKALATNNIFGMVCRSKSGGAHLYVFLQEPGLKAPLLIEYLKKLRSQLGIDYRKAREIFPKQAKQVGGIGNWINLPYFNAEVGHRKAIKEDGTDYSLGEFLDAVRRVDPAEFAKKVGGDGELLIPTELPPCLECLVRDGVPNGQRNEALFNFTVFAAKRHQLDRTKTIKILDTINTTVCQPPVPSRELNTTLDSVLKHEYNYRCDQSPLVDYCDKVRCAMRPYGPSASMRPSNIPEIEKIEVLGDEVGETKYHVKLSTCPKMVVCSAKEIFDYNLLRRATLDTTHVMLPSVKPKDWDAYITARWSVLSETMRVARERTKIGMLDSLLENWLRRYISDTELDFKLGRPYFMNERIYINLTEAAKVLKEVTSGKIDLTGTASFLENAGWEKTELVIDGTSHALWVNASNGVKPIQHETKKVEMQETMVEIPKPQEEQAVVEDIDWEQFSPHHQEEV